MAEVRRRERSRDEKRRVLARLAERDGPGCTYCGADTRLCIDHKQPLARGGSEDESNLQILCLKCNGRKGVMPDDEAQSSARFPSRRLRAGFTAAYNVILFDSEISPTARILYFHLCHYAWLYDHASRPFPTQTTIGVNLGLTSDRAVRTYVRELEAAGLIQSYRLGRGNANGYTIHEPGDRNGFSGQEGDDRNEDSAQTGTILPFHREKTEDQEPETTSQVPAALISKPRNEVWDALTEIFGKPGTRQKEIARGKVVGELRAAGVERGEQVHRLADEYRKTFSEDVALTQHALGKHADQLAHAIRGRQAKRLVAPCEFCGVGAGMHDADCVRPQAASA